MHDGQLVSGILDDQEGCSGDVVIKNVITFFFGIFLLKREGRAFHITDTCNFTQWYRTLTDQEQLHSIFNLLAFRPLRSVRCLLENEELSASRLVATAVR